MKHPNFMEEVPNPNHISKSECMTYSRIFNDKTYHPGVQFVQPSR